MKYEFLQITFTFSLQVLIVAEESSVKRVISGGEQVDVGQGQQQEEHSNLEKRFQKHEHSTLRQSLHASLDKQI